MDDVSANPDVGESEPGRAVSGAGFGEALCAGWQQGDAAAFAALVRRWQQPVARFFGGHRGPKRSGAGAKYAISNRRKQRI